MANYPDLLLAYYGDDFTGSTDALEFLSRAGIKTILFIEPPSVEQLSHYPGLQAIGVAGMTRSMPPDKMEDELITAFNAFKALGVAHVHYKVCSTFDSSPFIGSIGKAADVGAKIFNSPFIPLLVAAPALGRYCLFGNLFARMGIGSQGEIFRLDRHPSMSRHPVTPADESDLRVHLSRQTSQTIGLMDILSLELKEEQALEKLQNLIDSGYQIVLFDALNQEHLLPIGTLIDKYADRYNPLFSIGSSGIEMALGQYWGKLNIAQKKEHWPGAGKANNMLVVSGSCSPVTAGQINYALAHGFAQVAVDTASVVISSDVHTIINDYINRVTLLIGKGINVIVHTSIGGDDPRIATTYQAFAAQGVNQSETGIKTAQLYGNVLGFIALGAAEKIKIERLVIAGGDTSSFVARTMGIEAVEMIAPISPGAPLCKAYSPNHVVNGLQVNFKGGQVGSENYFERILEGQLI